MAGCISMHPACNVKAPLPKAVPMSDSFEQQDWVKFGVAAALSRQYAADQHAFFEDLATMLERALPEATQVVRHGGIFSKKTVQRITLTIVENRYILESPTHGSLQASRTHVVRGIALKTEAIPIPDWLEEIGGLLDQEARGSQAAREALSRLVG